MDEFTLVALASSREAMMGSISVWLAPSVRAIKARRAARRRNAAREAKEREVETREAGTRKDKAREAEAREAMPQEPKVEESVSTGRGWDIRRTLAKPRSVLELLQWVCIIIVMFWALDLVSRSQRK